MESEKVMYWMTLGVLALATATGPRAFLVIRGWVDPVVRVTLDDPNDPTPYWLISTRRPEELVRVLASAAADAR